MRADRRHDTQCPATLRWSPDQKQSRSESALGWRAAPTGCQPRSTHQTGVATTNGIEAESEHCLSLAENSIGLVTALVPVLGYETGSRIARRALDEGRKVADIVLEERLLSKSRLDELLRLDAMTRPSRIIMAAAKPKG
jgi:Fumarase C C-terminus